MVERTEVLKRLQLLRNKIGELVEYKEYRRKDIQEEKKQMPANSYS